MSVFDQPDLLEREGQSSSPEIVGAVVSALMERALERWQAGDVESARALWTKVIAKPDAPTPQRCDALFNRAVALGQSGEPDLEIADYTAVIDTADASPDQRAT